MCDPLLFPGRHSLPLTTTIMACNGNSLRFNPCFFIGRLIGVEISVVLVAPESPPIRLAVLDDVDLINIPIRSFPN